MTLTDFIATLALVIAAATFALQIRQWLDSGPKIHLSVIADAVIIPDDDTQPKLGLTVINRGNEATQITHFLVCGYRSRWMRWRQKSHFTALINAQTMPLVLDARRYWIETMNYNDRTKKLRDAGELYVGVKATHRKREYLIKVPTKSGRA